MKRRVDVSLTAHKEAMIVPAPAFFNALTIPAGPSSQTIPCAVWQADNAMNFTLVKSMSHSSRAESNPSSLLSLIPSMLAPVRAIPDAQSVLSWRNESRRNTHGGLSATSKLYPCVARCITEYSFKAC